MAKAKKQTDGAKIPKTLKRLAKAKVQGESVLDSMTEDEKGQFNADYVQQVLKDRYGTDSETASGREPAQDAKPSQGAPNTTTKTKYPWDTDGEIKSEEPTTKTDSDTATQIGVDGKREGEGDEILIAAETLASYGLKSLESLPFARARDGETRSQCWERLRREGRAAGMTRRGAIAYAGGVVDSLFPSAPTPESGLTEPEPVAADPIEPEPVIEEATAPIVQEPPPAAPADLGVAGLGDMPPDWPQLPANASLQVEIAWVSANRLRVRSGNGVDLSRALSPAPSYSALSWLETSILFPSKFADISVKATAQQDDEKEHVRREKLAIEEIRGLLAEMLE